MACNLKLELFRHLWGVQESPRTFLPRIKSLGYTGIETGIIDITNGALEEQFAEHELSLICMVFTAGDNVRDHLRSFREEVETAAKFRPVKITSHSGRDGFSPAESLEFFRGAAEIEADLGLPVAHETHRGRILFNPWITRAVLEAEPSIQLCADFSHWVCVCERLLDGEEEIVRLAASRTSHVHARVGYEQGPQVPDPRAPEYSAQVAAHEKWWDWIWDSQAASGAVVSTLTPEFGPPPYLHTSPSTNQPVANLAEICEWQTVRQRTRFHERFPGQ
jgi:sugar phosphate isomerase/epimerase